MATAEGETYRFHVRITAPPFSDGSGVNNIVWNETVMQTKSLMERWSKERPANLHEDVNALTLAVISLAAFGRKLDSDGANAQAVPPGYKMSFLCALADTTKYILQILVFPTWVLQWSPFARAALARKELEKHMLEIIDDEKAALSERGLKDEIRLGPRGNLVQSIMKASHQCAQAAPTGKVASMGRGFSDTEVMGNLWIYLLAGMWT